jgi:hypothetical protein
MVTLGEKQLMNATKTYPNGTVVSVLAVNAYFDSCDTTSDCRQITDVTLQSGDTKASVIVGSNGQLEVLLTKTMSGGTEQQFTLSYPLTVNNVGGLNIAWTDANTVLVKHESGATETVSLVNGELALGLNLPPAYPYSVTGMLGNNDGNVANDFDCKVTNAAGTTSTVAYDYCKDNLLTQTYIAQVNNNILL